MSDPIDFSVIKAAKSRDPEAEMRGLAAEPNCSKQPALRIHDVDGAGQIEIFSLGASDDTWFWQKARRVPRSDVHGPFTTEDDALVDARDAPRRTR